MSSEKFESLEGDLNDLIDALHAGEKSLNASSGEERKSAFRRAERKLEEANILVQEMESEAKLAPVNYRTQMLGRIRHYRNDIDQLARNLKRGSSAGPSGTDNYGFDRNERLESSNRAKLFQGHQSLQRTSESIARSHQIAAETDQIGVEIIDELGQQRETILRTRDRLEETDVNLGRSRGILKSMARRMATDKLILALIILVELAILGGLTYWKFFS
ncbi:vesicle transport through interaction with t-snares homolog 1b-like [Plakobranchus ocellatus]|uniref:Vesicle transport through interaction with t-snares homolog 1b-like n=1 Tax=Plakobranchus ocellatus TaxID=259542 RepID=A0AAV4C426_9GAST|nr:vesicle transport through interaction with t-snares homolog 1b-like [Plakobranchus ocellatus]